MNFESCWGFTLWRFTSSKWRVTLGPKCLFYRLLFSGLLFLVLSCCLYCCKVSHKEKSVIAILNILICTTEHLHWETLHSVLAFENSPDAKVARTTLCCSLQKTGRVRRQWNTRCFVTQRWGNLQETLRSIHIITSYTFTSPVRWVEVNQQIVEQELDQEYVATWEDKVWKENKLGQSLTFAVPLERKNYPSVDCYEFINDTLEISVFKYLAL